MTIDAIRAVLANGGLNRELGEIYGVGDVTVQSERYLRALTDFRAFFGCQTQGDQEAMFFSAPGRAEICGNHTDHQRGRVLAAAVNIDAIAVAAATDTPVIRIKSQGYDEIIINTIDFNAFEKGTPKALVKGVLRYFADNGLITGGANVYITSDVLEGSGLSSSAAFETLIGAVFYGLFIGWPPPPLLLAQAGRYAENVYFGKPSGLMDQMSSAGGGFMFIDFAGDNPVYERIDSKFETASHVLAIVGTGTGHAELTGEYAAIPEEMGRVAAAMGKDVLGQCDETALYNDLPRLRRITGDRAILRAIHFFSENKRVAELTAHLKNNNFPEFLMGINASGYSSMAFLQNVFTLKVPDQPISLALALSQWILGDRGACRVHGGGFAGTMLAIVPDDLYETYRLALDGLFGAGSCAKLTVRNAGACKIPFPI